MIATLQRTFTLPIKAYIAIVLILFASAAGPIAIKYAQAAGAPSLYIVAARLVLASIILTPFVLKQHRPQIKSLSGKEWLLIVASATCFVFSLLLLFFGLEYTNVLATTVIRRTTPLWVIWLEIIFLGVVFSRNVWLGLLMTLIGSLMVGLGSAGAVEAGSNPLLGAVLALAGSLSLGLYMLIGRKFKQRLPTLAYIWLVFSIAAVIAVLVVFVSHTPISGYSRQVYIWILIVTFITQFLGHVPINVGLQYFHATYLSLILQAAIVAGAILAFIFFGEVPSIWQVVGSAIIMIGIAVVSRK